jgi:hypothetical protein
MTGAGDVAAIQREVMPAIQADRTLGEWLSQPVVGDWLRIYLQNLRLAISESCYPDMSQSNGSVLTMIQPSRVVEIKVCAACRAAA